MDMSVLRVPVHFAATSLCTVTHGRVWLTGACVAHERDGLRFMDFCGLQEPRNLFSSWTRRSTGACLAQGCLRSTGVCVAHGRSWYKGACVAHGRDGYQKMFSSWASGLQEPVYCLAHGYEWSNRSLRSSLTCLNHKSLPVSSYPLSVSCQLVLIWHLHAVGLNGTLVEAIVKCSHSSLNVRILSSASVPFSLRTVQMPNLALQ
jgi:hypothetical protein